MKNILLEKVEICLKHLLLFEKAKKKKFPILKIWVALQEPKIPIAREDDDDPTYIPIAREDDDDPTYPPSRRRRPALRRAARHLARRYKKSAMPTDAPTSTKSLRCAGRGGPPILPAVAVAQYCAASPGISPGDTRSRQCPATPSRRRSPCAARGAAAHLSSQPSPSPGISRGNDRKFRATSARGEAACIPGR